MRQLSFEKNIQVILSHLYEHFACAPSFDGVPGVNLEIQIACITFGGSVVFQSSLLIRSPFFRIMQAVNIHSWLLAALPCCNFSMLCVCTATLYCTFLGSNCFVRFFFLWSRARVCVCAASLLSSRKGVRYRRDHHFGFGSVGRVCGLELRFFFKTGNNRETIFLVVKIAEGLAANQNGF